MLSVLNKRWLSKAWRAMEDQDAEPMALVFIEKLEEANVPYQLYDELFSRSVKMRAQRMAQGLNCDDFSVDMMLACWPALQKEIREKEIEARNMLPSTAESQCRRCMGLGKEYVYQADGKLLGVKQSCDHRPLVEGEWLFGQAEREKQSVPIEIKTADAVHQVLTGKFATAKPVQDDGRELLAWCSKEFIHEYLRNRPDPDSNGSVRKFSYRLFGRTWITLLDEWECQRIGVMVHHAADYIRLGPKGYAKLNGITLPEEQ